MNRELDRQLKNIEKHENKILNKKDSMFFKSKIEPTLDKIQDKIPEKLMSTLEAAFFKGFKLVFEKGHHYIDKTYNKEKLEFEYYLNDHAVDMKMNRRHLKRLDKHANSSKRVNSIISVMEGGILGTFGIGIPDIPIFISVIMRSIYETAEGYGYNHETESERIYILLLICGAISKGEKQKKINELIDAAGRKLDNHEEIEISLEEQVKAASAVLSEAMLTAKFIQGIPIVGAVGGIVNYNIIKKVTEYSNLKYKKRYLTKKQG